MAKEKKESKNSRLSSSEKEFVLDMTMNDGQPSKASQPASHINNTPLTGRQKVSSVKTRVKDFITKHKVLVGVTVATIILIIVGIAVLPKQFDMKDVAFTINGKKYYKDDIKKLQDEAAKDNISAENAKKMIIEAEKKRAAALKAGVKVGNARYMEGQSEWHKIRTYNEALGSELQWREGGGYEVAVYYLPFSRLQMPLSGVMIGKPVPEGYGQPSAIASDRAYADSKAKHYHSSLSSGAMADSQAISEIVKDKRLLPGTANNKSAIYQVNEAGEILQDGQNKKLDNVGWMGTVKTLKPGQLTPISVGKLTLFTQNPPEGYFYFVKLIRFTAPQEGVGSQFESNLNKIKVVEYGE